ncbi:MAG: PDZ domain-containing protein, partial [Lachnospiraceae bacterium]|nr:PDZ domain-containing protein [Lachnospiraceae bacterium]
ETDPGVITAISSASVKGLINRMTNREPGAVLGIHAIDVPVQAVEEDGVPEGVAVTQVEVGSPAMDAGIRSGDIIVSARGTGVKRYSDFLAILESAEPGDTLTFTVMRPGNEGYESTRFEAVLGSTGQE